MMGYDMYWDRTAGRPDNQTYFRINIGGMGNAVDMLAPLGIVNNDGEPGPWPDHLWLAVPGPEQSREIFYQDGKHQEYVNTSDGYTTVDISLDDLSPEYRSYHEGIEAYLSAGYGEAPGVPWWKVYSSNDSWHVTPGEIRTGVAWADHHHPGWRDDLKTDAPYYLEFVEWMESAAEHGNGFRTR